MSKSKKNTVSPSKENSGSKQRSTATTLLNAQKVLSNKLFIVGVVLLCIVFAIFFLYRPTKDYYHSLRDQQKAEAQFQVLSETNQKLMDEIEYLQTEEGIKQRASDVLGLVEKGESTGVVTGLSTDNSDASTSVNSASSKLAYKQIKAPTTFYSPLLDAIFDYS